MQGVELVNFVNDKSNFAEISGVSCGYIHASGIHEGETDGFFVFVPHLITTP